MVRMTCKQEFRRPASMKLIIIFSHNSADVKLEQGFLAFPGNGGFSA